MDSIFDPDLEQSVKDVMATLPPVLRRYLGQGKYSEVAKNLMTKYGLHIDQGTILEREIMLLLMGIEDPDEFVQSLIEEGRISSDAVGGIAQDVNDQIFVPLREEMRRGETAPVPKPPTPVPQPQAPKTNQSLNFPASSRSAPVIDELPKGFYAPPPQSPRYPNQEGGNLSAYVKPVQQAYRPPTYHTKPVAPQSQPTPQPARVAPAAPITEANKLLEDHEEPHIEFGAPTREAVARTAPPPPNLPGVVPSAPAMPAPKPVQSTPPVAPESAPAPRTYAVDPYREPIDDISA